MGTTTIHSNNLSRLSARRIDVLCLRKVWRLGKNLGLGLGKLGVDINFYSTLLFIPLNGFVNIIIKLHPGGRQKQNHIAKFFNFTDAVRHH